MLFGTQLHQERGADAVLQEARDADAQGFDSGWLFYHLMGFRGTQSRDEPLDSFTLMTAVGAVTNQTRLACATLNPSFRNPALLAKMLATLDQITHGRVIVTLGAGWFKDEYEAFDIPFLDDHDARVEHEREVVQLLKELWTHPAPQRVTFEGQYVRARNLPFNPAPYQQPHPPIWIGGDSEATLGVVKDLADGWMMLRSGNKETLASVLSAPDWPSRPLSLVRGAQIVLGETPEAALAEAKELYDSGRGGPAPTFEGYLQGAIVGTAEYAQERIAEIESWGINYLRCSFATPELQERFARTVLAAASRHEEVGAGVR